MKINVNSSDGNHTITLSPETKLEKALVEVMDITDARLALSKDEVSDNKILCIMITEKFTTEKFTASK